MVLIEVQVGDYLGEDDIVRLDDDYGRVKKGYKLTRLEKIKSKQAVIGIVGLGYVGLPLAQAFCQQGIKVVGFDIDQEKIDLIEKDSLTSNTLAMR